MVSAEGAVEGSSDEVLPISPNDPGSPRLLNRIAAALSEVTRDSDSTGILGTKDFLVLAPGTGEEGAAILASRLVETLNDRVILEERRRSKLQFSAGYYAALDGTGGSLRAKHLIGRSMEALRAAQVGDPGRYTDEYREVQDLGGGGADTRDGDRPKPIKSSGPAASRRRGANAGSGR